MICLLPYDFRNGCYQAFPGFRSIVDVRGGDPLGLSLFSWVGSGPLPSEATPIAANADDVLSVATAAILTSALNLKDPLPAMRFADVLAHLLTTHADPTNTDAPKPLTPDHGGRLDVWILGSRHWRHKFDPGSPYCSCTLDLLRRDWKRCKKESHDRADAMDPQKFTPTQIAHARNLYRRVAGSFEKETGCQAFVLTQSDKEEDQPHKPETTITESFPGTGMFGGDLSWTQTTGSFDNDGDKGRLTTVDGTFCNARADSDLSSANHYAQVLAFDGGAGSPVLSGITVGAASRFHGSAATFYHAEAYADEFLAEEARLRKCEAGSETALDATAVTLNIPCTMKCQASGSSISYYFDGSLVDTVTDTAITGNTRAGVTSRDPSLVGFNKFDSFEAADVAAGSGIPVFMHHYMQMNGSR